MFGRKNLVSAVEVAAGGLAEVEELEVDWQDLVAVQDVAKLNLLVLSVRFVVIEFVNAVVVTYWNQANSLVAVARVDIDVVATLWGWVVSWKEVLAHECA